MFENIEITNENVNEVMHELNAQGIYGGTQIKIGVHEFYGFTPADIVCLVEKAQVMDTDDITYQMARVLCDNGNDTVQFVVHYTPATKSMSIVKVQR